MDKFADVIVMRDHSADSREIAVALQSVSLYDFSFSQSLIDFCNEGNSHEAYVLAKYVVTAVENGEPIRECIAHAYEAIDLHYAKRA